MCLGTRAPEIARCFWEHMLRHVFLGGPGMGMGTMHLHAWGAWEQERVHVCVHGLSLSCQPGAHLGWHTLPARPEPSSLRGGTLTALPFGSQ